MAEQRAEEQLTEEQEAKKQIIDGLIQIVKAVLLLAIAWHVYNNPDMFVVYFVFYVSWKIVTFLLNGVGFMFGVGRN